jgi:hypothetical protein
LNRQRRKNGREVTNLMGHLQEEDIDPIWMPLVTCFVLGHLVIEICQALLMVAMKHESTLKTLGKYNEKDANDIVGRTIVIVAEKDDDAMDEETTEPEPAKVPC